MCIYLLEWYIRIHRITIITFSKNRWVNLTKKVFHIDFRVLMIFKKISLFSVSEPFTCIMRISISSRYKIRKLCAFLFAEMRQKCWKNASFIKSNKQSTSKRHTRCLRGHFDRSSNCFSMKILSQYLHSFESQRYCIGHCSWALGLFSCYI